MLFRALSGLMSVTAGVVSLDGKILKKDFPVLPNLGILLENVLLYPELTGYENLEYLARFNRKVDKTGIIDALRRLDQDSVKLIRGLIKSEKERGAIVLLASHNKEDIQLLCDHTFTMDSGAIVGR